MSLLSHAAVFLGAAVVAVPMFKRLGLGAVLGYLVAGALIGPWGLRIVTDVENILHFSELGVVLLLFLIGLELQPSRLWVLRRAVFGLGGAQVAVTGALIALIGIALGHRADTAAIAGLGLSLSSTAFVLQILAEKGQMQAQHGRSAFAILLFQDLAVIPLLALLPLLGPGGGSPAEGGALASSLKAVAVVLAVVAGGRYLLRPVFRAIAAAHAHEIFTAAALLVVLGTALLMEQVGLSMSLGAFMAGVLLADSEYRHELEADIEPFKGLLMGLFFIAVGMSANIGLLIERPLLVLGLVLGMMALKAGVLFVLGRASGHAAGSARDLALALPQGGEFAFVLFGLAAGQGIMDRLLADLLVVVVTLSMAITPLVIALGDLLLQRWRRAGPAREFDAIEDSDPKVIIAGYGRFGQIVSRVLRTRKIPFTALDASATQVDFVRKYGNKIYYGDASRLDLLRAARADKAKIFVLAIDDVASSVKTAELVKRHFPELKIYARARNRQHAYQLMDIGVEVLERETLRSSLEVAARVLEGLGTRAPDARAIVERFRAHDERVLLRGHAVHNDEAKLIEAARQAAQELEGLFETDESAPSGRDDRAAAV
ncbi:MULTISPECIES: monovalent cation:proton antiporter-2 (CPA2) family protein [Sorangium]|uniref:Potassium transporter n=1 Tax=Sorangium cellulosum TaxID=56 RepID=A0A4P2QWK8_SORCE|nr:MULTISPECIES: monovalent cation:proton antiporter-2 (CPA2) family protein [Sorangium]AUX34849.1 potassium transporter [Sorangium cellulosum]WCQ94157.1 Glutathione-regulated potassium-efflux system protein KefC [Sorangium sp. Soce836]